MLVESLLLFFFSNISVLLFNPPKIIVCFYVLADPRNCIEIFEAKAMPSLIKGMGNSVDGLKGATAQTCRNIYVLGETHF